MSKGWSHGRRALVWSFFVPPAGVVLGIVALRKPDDERDRDSDAAAWLAIGNGAIACALLLALIVLGPPLFRWWVGLVESGGLR